METYLLAKGRVRHRSALTSLDQRVQSSAWWACLIATGFHTLTVGDPLVLGLN